MFAAVDLHQLADALAPMAGLVDMLSPLLAVSPNPSRDHPPPQCLAAERDPVPLAHAASRSAPSRLPTGMSSTAEIPDGARTPAAAPPPRSSAAADPYPATLPAAKAPRRSSAEPSPQHPPDNPWAVSSLIGRGVTF